MDTKIRHRNLKEFIFDLQFFQRWLSNKIESFSELVFVALKFERKLRN
jgi:hypothetical protein